ncbi:glycosyltransferase family 39 protein [Chloroflexota bacterium]
MLGRSIAAGNGYRWYAQDDLDLIASIIDFDTLDADYDSRGIITSFRAPLYPAFLALIYWIFGAGVNRFLFVRIAQAVIGALLVPLIYLISSIIWPGNKRMAEISAILVSIYPMFVIYPLSLATENLFFILILLSLFFLLKASQTNIGMHYLLCGILLGLSSLTRSIALGFAVLSILWVFVVLKHRKNALILLCGLIVIVLPWIVRNSLLHDKLMGVESSLGYNLYLGYHPKNTGTFQFGISLDLIPILDDGLRDEIGMSNAIEFIKSDPGRVIYLTIRKLGYFMGLEKRELIYLYSNNFFGYIPNPAMWLLLVLFLTPFIIISLSAVVGFFLIPWNRNNIFLLLLILGYTLPHIFILGGARFHLALIPILALGAAYFWVSGVSILKKEFSKRRIPPKLIILSFIILAMLMNWTFELIMDKHLFIAILNSGGNTTHFPY